MKTNKILSTTFICLAMLSISLLFLFVVGLFTIPFEIEGLIITVSTALLSILFVFLGVIYSKEYKLKYFFLGKNYKNQVAESLKKLNISNPEFINKFINERKKTYRQTGKIYNYFTSSTISKDNTIVEKVLKLYELLLKSIKSGGGFVDFCNSLDFETFQSGWEVYNYLSLIVASNELTYLLFNVYLLTDFCLKDNGLSVEYTQMNNRNIEILNNIYSPALMNCEQEISLAIEKLETALNK